MIEIFGRFSVVKGDPGHVPFIARGGFTAGFEVTVNGEPVPQVVTADTEAGTVLANETDADGRAFLRGNEVAQTTISGEVRVFISDEAGQ